MAKPAQKKTNACRALDALGIPYELRAYDYDEEGFSTTHAAESLGMPLAQVFKTLCVRALDGAVLIVAVPGDRELDTKALARLAGKRAVEPVAARELFALTGYVRGGVTALACKKAYPAFVDEAALRYALIGVSAGQRGLELILAPADYVRATHATVAALARRSA